MFTNKTIFLVLSMSLPALTMEKEPTIKPPKLSINELIFTKCDGGCPKAIWDKKTFPGKIKHNNPHYKQIFVHTKNGLHIGLINFGIAKQNSDKACNIKRLDVHPEFRHQGIGTQLLHRAIEIMAQQQKCSVIEWQTTPESRPFYKKLGAEEGNGNFVMYKRAEKGPIIKTPPNKNTATA